MRKKFLEKRIQRLQKKIASLKSRCDASTDVAEVRSLTEALEDIKAELQEAQEELDAIEAEGAAQDGEAEDGAEAEGQAEQRSASPVGSDQTPPSGAQRINGAVARGSFAAPQIHGQERTDDDPFATTAYRTAFMRYVQRGEAIPENLCRRDGYPAANTDSLGAIIPTTILNEFINELGGVYGNLYSKVRKLNVRGGVKIPIAKLQATFTWVTEGTQAPSQNGGEIKDFVEFGYNIASIKVSQTLLSSIITLGQFEREIVKVMMEAYLQAMDSGIVSGTGVGQMLGILNDPRVNDADHTIEMTAAEFGDWVAWRKKFFAKLPLKHRAGEFIFPLATVDSYLETMADANNNPIFRQATGLTVNDGDSRNPNGRFFGRDIDLVEPDIIADFDSASNGDVVGIFWQPGQYAINTNMAFGMRRYYDEAREEWVNKILTVVDGKTLNTAGFRIIKKKV